MFDAIQDFILNAFIFLASLLGLAVVIVLWVIIIAVILAVILDIKNDEKGGIL
jgi:hypothetical protein